MKNNFDDYKSEFMYYFRAQKFKILVVIMFIIAIYCSIALTRTPTKTLPYIPSILAIFSNNIFIVFLLLISLVVNTMTFDLVNNYNYAIRFYDKKNYMREIIKKTVIFSTIIYLVQLIFILICLVINCHNGLGIYTMKEYNLNIIYYTLFVLIKNMVLVQCVSVIYNLMVMIINKALLIGISILYDVNLLFTNIGVVDTVFRFRFIDYLITKPYPSFIIEFICCLLYIFILICFIKVVKLFVLKYIKKVGE